MLFDNFYQNYRKKNDNMIQYTKIMIKEKNISMKEKQVLELANILGYHIEKKTIYGVNNGYHFSLNLLSNKKIPTYQVSILVNKVMTLDNIKTIRKELQFVVSMNEEHNAFLLQALINFPKENENKKDFFIEFMNTLTKALQKENIDDYNRCLFCNDDKEKEEKECNKKTICVISPILCRRRVENNKREIQ